MLHNLVEIYVNEHRYARGEILSDNMQFANQPIRILLH